MNTYATHLFSPFVFFFPRENFTETDSVFFFLQKSIETAL